MITLIIIGLIIVVAGLTASLLFLIKALYHLTIVKKEQLFSHEYKEYKKFSKKIDKDPFFFNNN
jgi:hypothetical protein